MNLFALEFDFGKLLMEIQYMCQTNNVSESLQKTTMSDFIYHIETEIYSTPGLEYNYLLQQRFHDSAIVLATVQCEHQCATLGFDKTCSICLIRLVNIYFENKKLLSRKK